MAKVSLARRLQLAQRLETLAPGTPVFCGEARVGAVDGVYAEGKAEVAEYLAVRWDARDGMPVLIATKDVESLESRGVVLMGAEPSAYETAPRFDSKLYPSLRRLR
ncbi:MAG: hypothetical protein JO359_07030 [Candidatus Eremiobacteraeota bacterium]|nr:hypothetical protein [Candidatus Eremiobacteraeota bacterium]